MWPIVGRMKEEMLKFGDLWFIHSAFAGERQSRPGPRGTKQSRGSVGTSVRAVTPCHDRVALYGCAARMWGSPKAPVAGACRPTSLTRRRFSPVKPRTPLNLTIDADVSRTWRLSWSNPYPSENFLHSGLSYQVIVSDEDDPVSVSGPYGVSAPPLETQVGGDTGPGVGDGEDGWANSNQGLRVPASSLGSVPGSPSTPRPMPSVQRRDVISGSAPHLQRKALGHVCVSQGPEGH